MAPTESSMLRLGTAAPEFALIDAVSGAAVGLHSFDGKKALLVLFICVHCPYVKHIEKGLVTLAQDYEKKSLAIVAISSNDVTSYPEDNPASMKQQAEEKGFTFPYLYDAEQTVAKSFRATCTPDIFLFNEERKLVYRGQMDSSRPGNGIPVTAEDLRFAINQTLAGKSVPADQIPSTGCSIKWKK